MTNEITPVFSDGFKEHLATYFDPNDVEQLAVHRSVDVPYVVGEQVTYSRINEGQGTPTLIVSGFTEGITSLSPLALELTNNSDGTKNDTIIVDQQQVGSFIDETKLNKKGRPTTNEATEMQALNYLAVLEKENPEGPIRIVAHSYGALITQKLLKLSKEKSERTGSRNILEGAEIVFVAPAGTHKKESLLRLGGRFAIHTVTEMFSKKSFHDHDKEMLNKGFKNFFFNKRRTWQEIRALSSERINYWQMRISGIGSLAVMAFAEDRLYPQKALSKTIAKDHVLDAGVTYLTPIKINPNYVEANDHIEINQGDVEIEDHGRKASVKGSTHNDSSFTPSRVGNAIKQYFKHLEINRLRDAAHEERKLRNQQSST